MRRLGGCIALGLLTIGIGSCIQVSRLRHTCVICRLYRVDTMCLGLTHSAYSETDCSLWYSAHVEPMHAHVWERGTCSYMSNLLGYSFGVGCSPGRFPIVLLSPTTQLKVYQCFRDPLEAKALFADLTDSKTHDDRLDEDDVDRGHLTVEAIKAWEVAGFPGTWNEWWSRFYAKHVEEHTQWLTWRDADTGLNFREWQRQRKTDE